MRVTITGANGFIGRHLARAFAEAGHAVVGVSRKQPEGVPLDAFFRGELPEPLDPVCLEGSDLVIHGAMDLRSGSYGRNVEGTRTWVEQAEEAGVGRQIFLTSYMAHADSPSEYGKAKYALEQWIAERGGIGLRLSLVVGDGGIFADMVAMLCRMPIVPVIGGNRIRKTLSDVDTVCEAALRAQEFEPGAIHNLFSPIDYRFLDLLRQMRAHYGLRCRFLPVPLWAAKLLLRTAEAVGLRSKFTYERCLALEKSQGFGHESSYAALGLRDKPLAEMFDLYSPSPEA